MSELKISIRIGKYILGKKGQVIKCNDLNKWSKWFETSGQQRVVADTIIKDSKGRIVAEVSTVFLSLDHNFLGKGKPILWETMVFGSEKLKGKFDCRYRSKAEALKEHNKIVAKIKRLK